MNVGQHALHADANLDFQLNRLVSDGDPAVLRDVADAARRIVTFEDWTRELVGLADRAEAAGHLGVAARYVRAAEFFVSPGAEDKRRLYERFRALFERAFAGRFERTRVRFRGAELPVMRLPSTRKPARTLLVHGGFDSFIEEFFPLLQGFADANLDVVAFEGPGQGEVLVRQGVPMTHAWEQPTSAVIDALGLEDVTLLGISLGGYLGLRAAAFEDRIRRVIAFDVLDDFFECVTSRRGPALHVLARIALALGADGVLDRVLRRMMRRDQLAAWGVAQGMHVMGVATPSAFLRETRRYRSEPFSSRVTQDVLLLAGAEDHFVPVHQLERQARALTRAKSVTKRMFTSAEHAAAHCQVGNLPLVGRTIEAWLADVTRGGG